VVHLKKVYNKAHKYKKEKVAYAVVKQDLNSALKSGYFGMPKRNK